MTASRPSRVMAMTPLRIPVTIWRKKASGTPPDTPGVNGRPSDGSSSGPGKRGVRDLVKSGNAVPAGQATCPARKLRIAGKSPVFRRPRDQHRSTGLRLCNFSSLFGGCRGRGLRFGSPLIGAGRGMLGGVFLERLPLAHQVADLPHQRLVLVDELLRGVAVVIEPRGGHRRLEFLDPGFAVGDPCFQLGDTLLQRLRGALLLLALHIEALAVFAA